MNKIDDVKLCVKSDVEVVTAVLYLWDEWIKANCSRTVAIWLYSSIDDVKKNVNGVRTVLQQLRERAEILHRFTNKK